MAQAFVQARDFLLETRTDYQAAYEGFSWPEVDADFNWVTDYFDEVAAGNDSKALHLVEESGEETILTYAELADRSRQVANLLVEHGMKRGDRMLLMLGNQAELWESMLAAMRIGVVVIPATTLLAGRDLADRFDRGGARMVLTNETGVASVDGLDAAALDGVVKVQSQWGATIRDGYGQTETTAQVGNPPGAVLKAGSMGRPLPGYCIALLDPDDADADEGELSIELGANRPVAVMHSYADDSDKTAEVMRNGYYRTGDVAARDEDGYITYVGRADDVFKASGYRISPFELESVLVEHPAVAEAAVVPAPDELRGFVPKAYVVLAEGHPEDATTAADIFGFVRERVSGYKLVRRLEFAELPKTISGKIRRVELRGQDAARDGQGPRTDKEFIEADLKASNDSSGS
ncbi:Acyl-coenzyme A synthetase ACSM3, mitochondrial [Nymphon striatum]|nr:Acyl-coenzyme A synthetase ACSM3, mitochondrial [Nymphon striatum]